MRFISRHLSFNSPSKLIIALFWEFRILWRWGCPKTNTPSCRLNGGWGSIVFLFNNLISRPRIGSHLRACAIAFWLASVYPACITLCLPMKRYCRWIPCGRICKGKYVCRIDSDSSSKGKLVVYFAWVWTCRYFRFNAWFLAYDVRPLFGGANGLEVY